MICFLLAQASGAVEIAPIQKKGVSLRFVEAGEFRHALLQGAEMDLINESNSPATCDVRLILRRTDPATKASREIKRVESQKVVLPPNTRLGFRVAEPLIYGGCSVEYEVTVNGEPLAANRFEFDSAGPYRVTIQSCWLAKDAVRVHVEPLTPAALASVKTERICFKILNATDHSCLYTSKSSLWRVEPGTDENEPPRIFVEELLSFKGHPPGNYLIQVEILGGGQGTTTTAQLRLPVAIP